MRIIYMGTPEFSVAPLKGLIDAGHEIVAVYCQPPRPSGRGHKEKRCAVHTFAATHDIPVRTPASLKNADAQKEFAALDTDIAVVAAYGLILPKTVLDAPKHGCLNIHASILPRWRGAAPIQRAILAGDTQTGISIMQMDEGLDTGDVLAIEKTPITKDTTATTLHDTLSEIGAKMIVDVLAGDLPEATPQDDKQATYAKMLSRKDGRVDWQQPAADIERQIRALTPWPGVWCLHKDKRLKVHSGTVIDDTATPGTIMDRDMTIGCGDKALRLLSVQPENRKAMSGSDYFNGGVKLGDTLS